MGGTTEGSTMVAIVIETIFPGINVPMKKVTAFPLIE
jgi:hypothetical protein